MSRSIASRAIIPVLLMMTGFVTICSILLYTFIKDHMVNEEIFRANCMAETMIRATQYTMLKSDRETLYHTIQNIGDRPGVEHLRIFNKKGVITFSSQTSEVGQIVDKDAEGCSQCHRTSRPLNTLGTMDRVRFFGGKENRDVLAVTIPIYNGPNCVGACHVHSDDDQVLGTLDLGISQAALHATLWEFRRALLGFCIMVLVLVIVGVAVLLQRNVLSPIKDLVLYVEGVQGGGYEQTPPRGTEEIEAIGQAVQKMADRLESQGQSGPKG